MSETDDVINFDVIKPSLLVSRKRLDGMSSLMSPLNLYFTYVFLTLLDFVSHGGVLKREQNPLNLMLCIGGTESAASRTPPARASRYRLPLCVPECASAQNVLI